MWPFNSGTENESTLESQNIAPQEHPSHVTPLAPVVTVQSENKVSFTQFYDPEERLSLPFVLRAQTLLAFAGVCGFALGSANGGRKYADRFRAENAHRQPHSPTGWYLYHKSKNYHTMLGGVREGTKFAGICMGWAALFIGTEEILDQSRGRMFARAGEEIAPGQKDVANSVIAALSMAGIYSWKRGLDEYATAKTAKMALKYSLVYGLLQDVLATAKGYPPAYVSWVSQRLLGRSGSLEKGG